MEQRHNLSKSIIGDIKRKQNNVRPYESRLSQSIVYLLIVCKKSPLGVTTHHQASPSLPLACLRLLFSSSISRERMRMLSWEWRIPGCLEILHLVPGSSPHPLPSLRSRLLCPLGSLPVQPMGGPGTRRQRLKVVLPPAWLVSHVCPSLCPSMDQCLIDSLPTHHPWFAPHPPCTPDVFSFSKPSAVGLLPLESCERPWDWSCGGPGPHDLSAHSPFILPSHPVTLRLH